MIRSPVAELATTGRLPAETDADAALIEKIQNQLAGIEQPVTDEEASLLCGMFSPTDDSCFGLAWSLLHTVESAPGWPLWHVIDSTVGPWAVLMRQRASNDGNGSAA